MEHAQLIGGQGADPILSNILGCSQRLISRFYIFPYMNIEICCGQIGRVARGQIGVNPVSKPPGIDTTGCKTFESH